MKRNSPHDELEDNSKKVKDEKLAIQNDSGLQIKEVRIVLKRVDDDDKFRKYFSDLSKSTAHSKKIDTLSEYEKMIQKNRDEKVAFLESLKMDEVKKGLNEAVKNLKPQKTIRSHKSVVVSEFHPRKSLRLGKVHINLSEKAFKARALAKALAIKECKVPSILPFKEAITRDDMYADFACDFEDLDFKKPYPFTDYGSSFKRMKIDESKIAQVVIGNITAMAFHPMKEKIIVSAASQYGRIGFWQVNSDSVPYEFKPHIQRVSCLKFNSNLLNQVLSCSYDGTVRCGDMEKKVFYEVFNISDETSCNYFDFTSPSEILVCHKNGNVSVVDIRSHRKSAEHSYYCHDYPVTTVSVHPVIKSCFVSADVRGFLSLWDLRMFRKKHVIEVHHHRKAISSAFFSPVLGNSILTTSADESLCLFDSSKLGSSLPLDTKVRHNNYSKNGLSKFKATWLPNTDDAFVIGSMDYPRRIEIFNNQFSNMYNFINEDYFNSITPTYVYHPSLPVLAGGNFYGKVYIFS